MKKFKTVGFIALAITASCLLANNLLAEDAKKDAEKPKYEPAAFKDQKVDETKNPIVTIKTNKGDIVLELFTDSAPKTVKNFVELATGEKEFTDVATGKKVKRPFYDGLIFHRVIKGFMIQGGCPKGNGTGGPGYKFEDEINLKDSGLDKEKAMVEIERDGKKYKVPNPKLCIRSQRMFYQVIVIPVIKSLGIDPTSREDVQKNGAKIQKAIENISILDLYKAQGYKYNDKLVARKPVRGVIAMANSGPNTNGSQFFINLVDTDYLYGKHTVFGRVIKGMDIVDKIAEVKVDARSAKPEEAVKIISVSVQMPKKAEK